MNARILISGLLLCAVALLAGGSAGHATWTPYEPERELAFSVYPWPFGIVIAADEAALDPGEVIGTLAAAVEFACDQWALPVPTVPENWEEALDFVICDDGLWGRSFTEWIWPLGERWSYCLFEQGEVLLRPLAVVIYPSYEDQAETHRLWSRSAFFGEVHLKLQPALPASDWRHSPGVALTADHFTSGGGVVVHEITHWLQYGSLELRMLPRILREGMAELTEARWSGSEDYRTVSAAFAEANDLLDVPPIFHYSAGASLLQRRASRRVLLRRRSLFLRGLGRLHPRLRGGLAREPCVHRGHRGGSGALRVDRSTAGACRRDARSGVDVRGESDACEARFR